ncbi:MULTISPECIES: hypothetical protein [Halomicrobium]|uniref:Uncharacterized protein n=1 Tax=Halomicrobium mukohataei TaxID=57705 RepID=A0A4D6KFC1_9EURY|nr:MULTISPECIES: hypothetical protein [Halomicrobium]QCD65569.1 hypothetical protein E5139_07930 [Halomicrobium mukohataei]QFR20375.1 hypothetical protein GBQ70_07925 [Halomicrobium sp. ZPS1]
MKFVGTGALSAGYVSTGSAQTDSERDDNKQEIGIYNHSDKVANIGIEIGTSDKVIYNNKHSLHGARLDQIPDHAETNKRYSVSEQLSNSARLATSDHAIIRVRSDSGEMEKLSVPVDSGQISERVSVTAYISSDGELKLEYSVD